MAMQAITKRVKVLEVMKLYSYYRSSASYRVRIALALKGIRYEYIAVNLAIGEHRSADFLALSGNGLVPLLVTKGQPIGQSLAIIEYLDELHQFPALLPVCATYRALARAIAQSIACEIHPLNNLRVLRYLESTLQHEDAEKTSWYHHWTRTGLETVEHQLRQAYEVHQGRFSFGKLPGLVDCVLVPQIYNARRFNVPLQGLQRILDIEVACQQLSAFALAAPENCPDCPEM
jgi:maleylacetoacetate isomerase/maleylpyruvate isomerase